MNNQEPLESSLLCRREDGTPQFVHDTYTDFFIADWFANRINSGELSVVEAYNKFWTYTEDSSLWGLRDDKEYKSILPSFKPILLNLIDLLEDQHCSELILTVSSSYNTSELKDSIHNPFFDDLVFAAELAGHIEKLDPDLMAVLRSQFTQYLDSYVKTRSEEILGSIREDYGGMKKRSCLESLANLNDEGSHSYLVNADMPDLLFVRLHAQKNIKGGKNRFLQSLRSMNMVGAGYSQEIINDYKSVIFRDNLQEDLVNLLDDPEWNVRSAAGIFLCEVGYDKAANLLLEQLRDPVWDVSYGMACHFHLLGAKIKPSQILRYFETKGTHLSSLVTLSSMLGVQETKPFLIEILKSPGEEDRVYAAHAAKGFSWTEKESDQIAFLLRSYSNSVKMTTATALGKMKSLRHARDIFDLLFYTGSSSKSGVDVHYTDLHRSLLESLKELGYHALGEDVERLLSHDNPWVRHSGYQYLFQSDRVTDELIDRALDDGSDPVIHATIHYLLSAKIDVSKHKDKLLRYLVDNENFIGHYVALILSRSEHNIRDDESENLAKSSNEGLKHACWVIRKRGYIGDMEDIIYQSLVSDDGNLRSAAIQAVSSSRSSNFLPQLVELVRKEYPDYDNLYPAFRKLASPSSIAFLLESYKNSPNNALLGAIHEMHQELKPKGYNPDSRTLLNPQ